MRDQRVRWVSAAVCALVLLMQTSVNAHFLFVRIGPLAEGGRRAEVYFSEKAEAGDPRFIAKLTGTKLWLQAKPGEFTAIPVRPGSDRLVAPLPSAGSVGVIGICEYGVRAVPKQKPFLLRYYPKAVAGVPADLNQLRPRPEVPFEIIAAFNGEEVKLTVLAEGKPMPGAKLTTVDRNLSNETLTANAEGVATWKPGPGEYSVYTDRTIKTPGTLNGANYDEIREFTTLAFRFPLDRDSEDAEAVATFEKAIASRAQWRNFPGFNASITGNVDGRIFLGDVQVTPDGKATLKLDDASHAEWVASQLASIVLHRRAEPTDRLSERPILRFADEDTTHPLGRLLEFEGGRFASSYRVLDGRITTVNRDVGTSALTILTLETVMNSEKKELPRSYLVQTWDTQTGALTKTESVRDTWQRIGAFDLPQSHLVTISNSNGVTVRSFELGEIKLAK